MKLELKFTESGFHPKFRAGVLGATGTVGQQFVGLLANHPWIDIVCLGASSKSAGKSYGDVCEWRASYPCPEHVKDMSVWDAVADKNQFISRCDLVFSALDSGVAKGLEEDLAAAGLAVFTNAAAHRLDSNVPIVIPSCNPHHMELVKSQVSYKKGSGFICANANCSATGLTIALKPLQDAYGISVVNVVTMQAVSGAGLPGPSWWAINNNVIPEIVGEEQKLERETRKILGRLKMAESSETADGRIEDIGQDELKLSASCNRVPVADGHTCSVSVKLVSPPLDENGVIDLGHIAAAYRRYNMCMEALSRLPTAPASLIEVCERTDQPQPKTHAMLGSGMTVSIGRIRPCGINTIKFTVVANNVIIGAAGGSVFNAELAMATGIIQ